MADKFNHQRFVDAQERVWPSVMSELRAGRKRSHWMWFVFPQVKGLGHSPTAQHYGIGSLEEARAYLAHDVLGVRLREATQLVLDVSGTTAEQIFGYPDYLKFRSSMTLFREAASDGLFQDALDKYYGGEPDGATLRILGSGE